MKRIRRKSRKISEPTTEADADGLKEVSLSLWEEIVGRCIDGHEDDGGISVTLRVNGQALKLIVPALNQDLFLPQFIGKRVGILRTDDMARPFVMREIRR